MTWLGVTNAMIWTGGALLSVGVVLFLIGWLLAGIGMWTGWIP